MIRRTVRSGLTLTEVLVAMFVMALGMISLLTLFPLGAMQVGDALRMDRATQTATSADAILRQHWRHNVVAPVRNSNDQQLDHLIWDGMDDPNLIQRWSVTNAPPPQNLLLQYVPSAFQLLPIGINPPLLSVATLPNQAPTLSKTSLISDWTYTSATPASTLPITITYPSVQYVNANAGLVSQNPNRLPSFPLMIDPLGERARALARGQYWVGGNSQTASPAVLPRFLIPRRTLGTVGTNTFLISNLFTMSDDLSFEKNGAPDPDPLGRLNRQGRYNWAAIIQRPQYDNRLVADLKIMVFDGRPPGVAGPEDEQVITFSWVNTTPQPVPDPTQPVAPTPLYLQPGQKSIALLLPARGTDSPALIRRGGWIMDGTTNVDEVSGLTGPRSIRNANFYRVVGVQAGEERTGPNGTTPYLIDLETPIVGPTTVAGTEPPAMIYLFANLTEVFERPALRLDQGN